MNIEKALADIAHFNGGVFDTSSLIYLSKIELLQMVAQVFSVHVIPQVETEFKRELPQDVTHFPAPEGGADQAIVEFAQRNQLAVISEDKQVLMAAKRGGLVHFNSLMVILGLLHHGYITVAQSRRFCVALFEHARYSVTVWEFGNKLLQEITQQRQSLERKTEL